MLWRQADLLVITQTAHAWLAGQLVRAWGSDGFLAPDPHEPVCLAAEQHDLGWLAWECAPTLNRDTGRPHMFRELPVAAHTALWRHGVTMAMTLGRYPALLVSLHGSGLYAGFDADRAAPEDAAAVRGFLADQHGVQRHLIAELAQDPMWRDAARPERIAANRALIAMADRLSLAICGGVTAAVRIEAPGLPPVRLEPVDGDRHDLRASPWPFRPATLQVVCEGRMLSDGFADEAAMRRALAAAPVQTVVTRLRPD